MIQSAVISDQFTQQTGTTLRTTAKEFKRDELRENSFQLLPSPTGSGGLTTPLPPNPEAAFWKRPVDLDTRSQTYIQTGAV